MKWYVKYKDGTINGPMSQVDAEIKRDGVDGAFTFSEQIFKPQFATFEEVEICLRDLRALVGDEDDDEDDCGLGEICQQAINVITLLCGKARKVELSMSVDIATLMLDLDKVLVGELRERAIKAIVSFSAKKIVRGTIEGGMLDISEVSPGVEVFINDYDIQEVDEDRTSEDEDGRRCVVLEFGGS